MKYFVIFSVFFLSTLSVRSQEESKEVMVVFLRAMKGGILKNIKHSYGQLIFDSKVSVGLDTTNVFLKKIGETKFTHIPIDSFYGKNLFDYDVKIQFDDSDFGNKKFGVYGQIYVEEKDKKLKKERESIQYILDNFNIPKTGTHRS